MPKAEQHHSPLTLSQHCSQLPMLPPDLTRRMQSWDTGQDPVASGSSHRSCIEGTVCLGGRFTGSFMGIECKK